MKTLVVANWKCNPTTLKEAKQLFNLVKRGAGKIKKTEVVICPPFIYLTILKRAPAFAKSYGGLAFGSQDCFWEKSGAYTGEISPAMLKDLGCQYVIVGHSERRRYFEETEEIINKKLKAVLETKINPILCIGETQEERKQEKTESVLRNQITSGLKGVSAVKFSKITIAYEPVWAVGTGNPCNVEEAQKMGLLIRKIISESYNSKTAKNLRILYGGSVNSKNAAGYIKEARLQGLLVGGASLNAKEFIKIVETVT